MVFVCVPGQHTDGHAHAPDAVARGAVALIVERQLPVDVPQIRVIDARRSMGPAAAAMYGHPDRDITVIGVTGTNGKTTVTHMLASMLAFAGRSVEALGTLSGPRTTPEATDLFARIADCVADRFGIWPSRSRVTHSPCTGVGALRSTWPRSPTCRRTISISTRRWRTTSRPKPLVRPRASSRRVDHQRRRSGRSPAARTPSRCGSVRPGGRRVAPTRRSHVVASSGEGTR